MSLVWTRADSLILVITVVVSGLLRFVRLSEPSLLVFDETYYAKDACLYTGASKEFCASSSATEVSWVHPQLGKWLIGIGIKIFGFNAFGWRFSAALFGTAIAGLVFLLARSLFRNRWLAGAAGLLVATDYLLIVQSRIAMLDIFATFFVVLGFLFLAIDRQRILLLREHARLPFPGEMPRRMGEWRLLAGAAFGAGVASKWQAGLGFLVGFALASAWSFGLSRERRHAPVGQPGLAGGIDEGRPALRELGLTSLAFVLVPALIYMGSYATWFTDNTPYPCSEGQFHEFKSIDLEIRCTKGFVGTLVGFAALQDSMLDFHATLNASHPYASPARSWPLVLRPVAFHFQGEPKAAHILAFGNPATWWAALGAAIWLLIRSLRRWRPERVVLAGWAGQYLPWLLVVGKVVERPAIFIFYMTPVVPFMMISLAAGLSALRDLGRVGRWAVLVYLVLGVGVLLWWFYPVIAAVGLPYDWWRDRMLLPSWI